MAKAFTTLAETWPQIAIYVFALVGVTWFLYREIKTLKTSVDTHDAKCSVRWTKNWNLHETNGQRLSYIEGKLDIERPTDT